jgi:hypothetical protein
VIESIGFYTQGDMRVFRAYFDEENCFVEVPVKLTNLQTPVHIRIFKTRNEDFPDAGLRELLIGGDDNEEPLIGFFKFQINATENSPEIIYDRSWIAGTNVPRSVSPFNLNETIMDNTKTEIQHDDHSIMLYQRDLPENVIEYMYTDFVNQKRPDGQQAEVFRTFVGIEIKASDIEIFPV